MNIPIKNRKNFKVKWVWRDDKNHFLVKNGDGSWSEYSSGNPRIDYKITVGSANSSSPMISTIINGKKIFRQIDDTQLLTIEDASNRAFRNIYVIFGSWDFTKQLGINNLDNK